MLHTKLIFMVTDPSTTLSIPNSLNVVIRYKSFLSVHRRTDPIPEVLLDHNPISLLAFQHVRVDFQRNIIQNDRRLLRRSLSHRRWQRRRTGRSSAVPQPQAGRFGRFGGFGEGRGSAFLTAVGEGELRGGVVGGELVLDAVAARIGGEVLQKLADLRSGARRRAIAGLVVTVALVLGGLIAVVEDLDESRGENDLENDLSGVGAWFQRKTMR